MGYDAATWDRAEHDANALMGDARTSGVFYPQDQWARELVAVLLLLAPATAQTGDAATSLHAALTAIRADPESPVGGWESPGFVTALRAWVSRELRHTGHDLDDADDPVAERWRYLKAAVDPDYWNKMGGRPVDPFLTADPAAPRLSGEVTARVARAAGVG